MGDPISAEPPSSKSSKRKGTRSVSTLTPSQRARKRANNREAQRVFRARTKETRERLERELEELRQDRKLEELRQDRELEELRQDCDRTPQDLNRYNKALEDELQHMRDRNKALEDELSRLRESRGISIASSPYFGQAPCDQQHGTPGTMPTPRMLPLAASADYNPLPDCGQHYVPMSDSSVNSWDANVSSHIGFNVLSSSLSIDGYVSGDIPLVYPCL